MAFDTTVGGANSTSYASLAEAEAYLNSRLFTTGWAYPAVTIGSGANGQVTIDAVAYGAGYSVTVVAGVGNNVALSAALVGEALTITLGTTSLGALDPSKNTAVLVAAAVNALPGFTAVASGTGASTVPVTATTAFEHSASVKQAALEWATRILDSSFVWTGLPVDEIQALCWPRAGMLTRNGFVIPTNAIPRDLKYAQIELARSLVVSDLTADNDALRQGIDSVRAGSVSVSFRSVGTGSNSIQLRNADLMRQGPAFNYLSTAIPDPIPQ